MSHFASLPRFGLAAALLAAPAPAGADDLDLVDALHDPVAEHVDQQALLERVRAGDEEEAFEAAFEDAPRAARPHVAQAVPRDQSSASPPR